MQSTQNPWRVGSSPGSYVRLSQAIPELGLRGGEIGVVCGVLPGPADAYEVAFHFLGQNAPMRTLLLAQQVDPDPGPLFAEHDLGLCRRPVY